MAKFGIGQAVRRREDEHFLKGEGRYVDDISFPRQLFGVVVRPQHAYARDAADLVFVDYETLPAMVDLAALLDDEAVQVWEGHETNRGFRFTKGDACTVATAFDAAPKVVWLDLITNRMAPSLIEPRGSIGGYDAHTGRYTLHVSDQAVHGNKMQMAAAVFQTEPDNIRVVAGDVGGGFGAKNFVCRENILVMLAARLSGRPVKWIAEKTETFFAEAHGRDHVTHVELALDDDGVFLGLRVATIAIMGAYLSSMASAKQGQPGPRRPSRMRFSTHSKTTV